MKRLDLACWLRKIADLVETGDSAEGSIAWNIGDSPDRVRVEASIRIGNLDGQGGVMVISEIPDGPSTGL